MPGDALAAAVYLQGRPRPWILDAAIRTIAGRVGLWAVLANAAMGPAAPPRRYGVITRGGTQAELWLVGGGDATVDGVGPMPVEHALAHCELNSANAVRAAGEAALDRLEAMPLRVEFVRQNLYAQTPEGAAARLVASRLGVAAIRRHLPEWVLDGHACAEQPADDDCHSQNT